jgi:hypothetical protein
MSRNSSLSRLSGLGFLPAEFVGRHGNSAVVVLYAEDGVNMTVNNLLGRQNFGLYFEVFSSSFLV